MSEPAGVEEFVPEQPKRRSPWLWVAAGAGLVLVLGGIAGAAVLLGSDGGPQQRTPLEVAEAMGCEDDFANDTTAELFVDRVAECEALIGVPVRIRTFESQETLDNWWDVAEGFGTADMFRWELAVIEVNPEQRGRLDDIRALLN